MRDQDRRAPEPEEDKAILVRDEDGRVRLVPGGNIVEGEIATDGDCGSDIGDDLR